VTTLDYAPPGALAARWLRGGDKSPLALSAAVLLSSALVGAALAAHTQIGVALFLGLIYLPIALTNLQLALVLWFPLVFLEGMAAFNLAAKAGGLLIVGVWFVAIGRLGSPVAATFRRNAKLWLAVGGLLLWYTLSVLWADDRGMVYGDIWHWYAVALLVLVVATTVTREWAAKMLALAFVAGALFGVLAGLISSDLTATTATETRLRGGLDDPNFLAATIVPGIAIAIALRRIASGPTLRWLLLGVVMLLSLGLVASGSRGGIIAALVAAVAALVVFKNQRAWVVASLTIVVGVAAAWFAISPSAWERISNFDNGGSGREQIWAVAWRMVEDKPIQGVGLGNFPVAGADYVDEPGALERTALVVDKGQVVHNTYLQALAETGVIGLALFLGVAFGSVYAAWQAARSFAGRGDVAMETLARGVVVATLGMMTALFFLSGVDKRLWVLFGLCIALRGLAFRQSRPVSAGS